MKKSRAFVFVTGLILGGCCNEDFVTPRNYDFREGAIDVTSLIVISGSCFGDTPNYTTVGATPDGLAGDCWSNSGPLHNVWFKFRAPQSQNGSIIVYVGGSSGTQRRTLLALWDTDGVTQLGCSTFGNDADIVSIYDGGWLAGEYYYFSVDVQDSQSVGTFSLCLTDTD